MSSDHSNSSGAPRSRYSHPGPRPKRCYRDMNPKIAHVMRELYFIGKLKQHEIGRIFDKPQGMVSRIISGKSWPES